LKEIRKRGEKVLYIIYFNLKNGVSDEEKLVEQSKELSKLLEGKVKGLGSVKLYRHHNGANPRYYQMHMEMKDYATWDRFLAFMEKDAKVAKLLQGWRKELMDLDTHFDEFVIEMPL
jgi:hypothetical protein